MYPSRLCHDQLVVHGDKRASHLILVDADAFSDNHKERKKKPDHHPANLPVEKKVLSPEDGQHQGQPAADQESNDQRENNGCMGDGWMLVKPMKGMSHKATATTIKAPQVRRRRRIKILFSG
jgi:hypothetical protein